MKLSADFYLRDDVVLISRELLGKYIFTDIDGVLTGGIIVETEAYAGRNDKACHANLNRRTKRTEIMYQDGGSAYVYLCYGIHNLFNITTNIDGLADAVLLRAIEPVQGMHEMMERRKYSRLDPHLTAGPGKLTQALGINLNHYGESLVGNTIWIEEKGLKITEKDIISSTRVGVDYAGKDALLPWRFRIKNSIWTSAAK